MRDAYYQSLNNQRIAVVGLGLTGRACVEFLVKAGADVIAMDTRSELQVPSSVSDIAEVFLGELDKQRLASVDLIVLSPGVDLHIPAIQFAANNGVDVIGDVELFARLNTSPVIAITGSNGKSTVTMLTADMCKAASMKTGVGGNIGTPVLELLDQDWDIVVLELSSFQLETLSSLSPAVACILNISEDHLDRHKTLDNYTTIKQRIYTDAKHVVYNREDGATAVNRPDAITFGLDAANDQWGLIQPR